MKRMFLLLFLIMATGCTSSNQYGKCVGLNGHEDPTLDYDYDAWNIGVAVLFCSLIVPPIVVALNELKCPSGRKALPPVPAH